MSSSSLLPADFLRSTKAMMGTERFERFMAAFDEEPPVSIRLNPLKTHAKDNDQWSRVPWSSFGYYLPQRPNFTFDPLLHAGCYYVQEAASQFIDHVVAQLCCDNSPFSLQPKTVLDLCAAPGGKSLALRSSLPKDCTLVSNEPIRQRAKILSENIQKWGHANCIVTNYYPNQFSDQPTLFDLILCDVPCSGEGMFRKDPATIAEWSMKNVKRCQQLQRQIVGDIWPCLRPGGIMIYSTCTFNTLENEENVRWITEQMGATLIEVPILPEWGITGSLLDGFDAPVCRFIPGLTRSEGLFVAVLRKPGTSPEGADPVSGHRLHKGKPGKANITTAFPTGRNVPATSGKQKNLPQQNETNPAEPLSVDLDLSKYPIVQLPYATAIAFLQRQAINLPEDTPRGLVIVAFEGHPLGFVKNIGTRANNLYPSEWAIKSTHAPSSYTPVLPSTTGMQHISMKDTEG